MFEYGLTTMLTTMLTPNSGVSYEPCRILHELILFLARPKVIASSANHSQIYGGVYVFPVLHWQRHNISHL